MNNLTKIEIRKFKSNIKNSLLTIIVMSFSLALFFILLTNIFVVERNYNKYLDEHNADDLQIKLNQEIDISALTGQMQVSICKDLDIFSSCLATNWDDPSDINYLNKIVNQKLKENKEYYVKLFEKIERFVLSSTKNIDVDIRYTYEYDVGEYKYDLINMTDIDRPNIDELSSGEIAISKDFAIANHYLIGDVISIYDKDYVIKYLVELPDFMIRTRKATTTDDLYTYIILNDEDLFDIESDFYATYLIKGDVNELIEYGKNSGDIEVTSDHKLFRLVDTFKPRELNYKMSMIDLVISNVNIVLVIIGTLLFVFALIQTEYYFKNSIRKDEKQIYTLKALGYEKQELLKPYLYSNIAYYCVILLISLVVSTAVMSIFNSIIFNNFAVKEIYYSINILLFILMSMIVVLIATRTRILTFYKVLLGNSKSNIISKNSNKNSILKRENRLIIFNITQTIVLTIVIVVSLSTVFAISRSIDSIDDSYDYDKAVLFYDFIDNPSGHIYIDSYLTEVNNNDLESNVKLITIGFNDNDTKEIYSIDNHIITDRLEYGIIISSFASEVYNIDIDDQITISYINTKYTATVAEISNEYTRPLIYVSDDIIREIIGIDGNKSNFLYVDNDYVGYDKVIFDSELIINSASIASMITTKVILVLCSIMVITSSMMFIRLINIIFDSNKRELKILSILGYRKGELSKLQLRPYIIDSLIFFFIALLPSYLIFSYMSNMFTELYGLYMIKANLIIPYFITLLIFVVLYIINAIVLYKSFNKIEVYDR